MSPFAEAQRRYRRAELVRNTAQSLLTCVSDAGDDALDGMSISNSLLIERMGADVTEETKIEEDGADTCYQHLIAEVEPEDITPGMRVEAVWNEDRKGTRRDIPHFRPEKKK